MAAGNEKITRHSFTWRFLKLLMRPGALKTIKYIKKLHPEERGSLSDLLEHNAKTIPDNVAILFEDQVISWRDLNAKANQFAHFYKSRGIGCGDRIAVNLHNRPELLFAVMGGLKLGAIMAMINVTQTSSVLAHSLSLATPKLILVGPECIENMDTVQDVLSRDYTDKLLFLPENGEVAPDGYLDIMPLVERHSDTNLPETRGLRLRMPAYYIFTSGTTGMPKASISTHYKAFRSGRFMNAMVLDLSPEDVYYCPLPFYHSNALVLSWSGVLAHGATLAIGRKFSASKFWDECRQHGATAFCYIGELLRYLLNHPAAPNDKEHLVTKVLGNGLRPDIWDEFKSRFGIDRIHEFYASSEGMLGFVNLLNYDKTCGWAPGYYKDWTVLKYDIDKDMPAKDNGHYVRLKPGETGLMAMRVSERAPFDGYTDRKATETKLLRDVFEPGDAWFNTGDLITLLPCGHIQFADRVGDTFRWNGENVATTQVEAAVTRWPGAQEAVVYGVKVKGFDGRCGMLSLTPQPGAEPDLKDLARHLREELPPYAIPRFLRIQGAVALTATLKHKKSDLKADGFDPEKVDGPLYFLAPSMDTWKTLSNDDKAAIEAGKIRL